MSHTSRSPLTETLGALFEGSGRELASLDLAEVKAAFRESGAVLFRNFDVDSMRFKAFARSLASSLVAHGAPNRPVIEGDDALHLADPGMDPIDFHSELAYLPYRPDILWFHCAKPAAADGETTLCDGVALQAAIAHAGYFARRRLKLSAAWPEATWQRYFRARTAEEVHARIAREPLAPGDELRLDFVRGRLFMDYLTPATSRTRYGDAPAFCNAVLMYCASEAGSSLIAFEDGTPLDDVVVNEVRQLASKLEVRLAWQRCDVVMVDNSRVMHGRRGHSDPTRRIEVVMAKAWLGD
jgi:alpha-ketoglutarate-dependent taurine dioxygenase